MRQLLVRKHTAALPISDPFRIVVASDIHATKHFKDIIELIKRQAPDVIFIPGDLCHFSDKLDIPLDFLRLASDIAPTFYSFGNHERDTDESVFQIDGVRLLNDSYARFGEITIGGLRSGFRGQAENAVMETPEPNLAFLDHFESLSGVKLLLCHHPEYYSKYLRDRNIDLVFSGHAHGGQWRFFGKGVFAPGQGLFPKYTSGIYDGRLIVSAGLANTAFVPRYNNPMSLVTVDIVPR